MTSRARLALACAVLAAAAWTRASAQSVEVALEYRVKAAYLFNFTKFVEWPEEALRDGTPLTICTVGGNPFGPALGETIRGEQVNGRPLAARPAPPVEGCHLLFVPRAVPPAGHLAAASTRPILTVGESEDFLDRGGMVRFVLEDGRIRFEINHDAAARMHLRISSRLLRLARPTDGRPEDR